MGCAYSVPLRMSASTVKPTPRALARVFAPISNVKPHKTPETAEEAAKIAELKEEFAL